MSTNIEIIAQQTRCVKDIPIYLLLNYHTQFGAFVRTNLAHKKATDASVASTNCIKLEPYPPACILVSR